MHPRTILPWLLLITVVHADLASLEHQFRSNYDQQVGTSFAASVAELDAKYAGVLERSMHSVTQSGKLDEARMFQEEIQRIRNKQPMPARDDGAAPALAKLRGIYRAQFAKLLSIRTEAITPIVERFAAALGRHEEELIKAGRIQEAAAVKAYRQGDLFDRLTGDQLTVRPEPSATLEKPFENSLGMRFVPVPIFGGPSDGKVILFSVWETRVKDYAAFEVVEKREWPRPDFKQADDHPAVLVDWNDAREFSDWLTKNERAIGRIGAKDVYRLPTDHEWSCAIGIGKDEDAAEPPVSKAEKENYFPFTESKWPPKVMGNFCGEETKRNPYHMPPIKGYDDGYDRTAPVGSFDANELGLYDLNGNVSEWCHDWSDQKPFGPGRIIRGGGWSTNSASWLRYASRGSLDPSFRSDGSGFRVVLEVGSRE